MFSRLIIAAAVSASTVSGAMAWDGARAYHLRPENFTDISLTATYLNAVGTVDLGAGPETSTVDIAVLAPSYHRTFDLLGNVGSVLIGIPVGAVSFETSVTDLDIDSPLAQGDLYVGGSVGLVGMPSLSPQEYFMHKPGLQVSAEAKLFLPTGDYDPDRIVSLGQNRWSLQASLPITYVLGDTMLDPNLMTFEIRPVVQIFGDNEDAVGPAAVMSQDPIFGAEAHITRNFGNSIWAALDGYYETGGEISFDGMAQGDALDNFSLGATVGVVFSPNLAMRLSYRELVHSSAPDASGRAFELTTAFLF